MHIYVTTYKLYEYLCENPQKIFKDIVKDFNFIYQGTRISAGSEVYGIYKMDGHKYCYEK